MSRTKLIPELVKTFREWKAGNKRTSWLYCPICRHDLNGDTKSFLREEKDHWYYKCDNCGCKSKWSLHYPVPVVVAYQRVGGAMKVEGKI